MGVLNTTIILVTTTLLLSQTVESRRVRVRPVVQEDDSDGQEQTQYYAQEEENPQQQIVYVSSADQYNGLYGQPTAASRISQNEQNNEYLPRTKSSGGGPSLRTKEPSKAPPVQTIRNYNKVNDDGSFTFGYEAADGSFKEETRGTDCVVRGKYGYIDPDGNKREFTYVSGNPCDPNAPKDEEEERDEDESDEKQNENVPANYPSVRPALRPRPAVTVAPKPVTLFQTNYEQHGEEEQVEPEQILRHQPVRRPTYNIRPQQQYNDDASAYQRAQFPSTTPSTILYRHQPHIQITPRPVTASTASQTQLPATTYRPQLIQVSVTPRPTLLYTKGLSSAASTTAAPSTRNSFDSEFQRFQTDNHIVASSTPATLTKSPKSGQIYSSALVYDPATGQYNTQLYQTLPQTHGDFSLNHRIQPYVAQQQHRAPQAHAQSIYQNAQNGALYRRPVTVNPQQVYQQQQNEAQFQNSAQLYAQQEKARALQQQLRGQHQQPQQQYYFVQSPRGGEQDGGHLAAFLRGHNIQF